MGVVFSSTFVQFVFGPDSRRMLADGSQRPIAQPHPIAGDDGSKKGVT